MLLKQLLIILWMQWLAILVFLYGFLPVKTPNPGWAKPSDIPQEIANEWKLRKVGQVVLVVIDALRVDFLYPEPILANMGIVMDGKKLEVERPKIAVLTDWIERSNPSLKAFVARVNSPTVTMPRIKAMMSGTIPGFVDFLLNFGSDQFTEDNLLDQWIRSGLNLTFFGDDTWIKLFPNHFMRNEGTNSFFVTDITEVDQNVTRHLEFEMKQLDWDVAILHYLGLDHIGHWKGPEASDVPNKLKEMGDVIEYLNAELINKPENWKSGLPPLIIVLGDHGMADIGGHGGASDPETLVPIIFISPLMSTLEQRSKLIKQTDLVPTLAWLTGIPIPQNSLGMSMFRNQGIGGMKYNAIQVAKALKTELVNDEFTMDEVELKLVTMLEAQEIL